MPDDVREYVDPWRRCPGCATGRLVEGVKDIDPSKPSWRRFDCGHFVDDQARLNAVMTPDFRKRYADALSGMCDLSPRIQINPDRRAAVVAAVAEAFGITPTIEVEYERFGDIWRAASPQIAHLVDQDSSFEALDARVRARMADWARPDAQVIYTRIE